MSDPKFTADRWQLYGTSACHLCDQATELVAAALGDNFCRVEQVDIAQDDQLLDIYGVRIPVLRNPASGRELDWPFDGAELLCWLRK